jgi:hypothetical protein
MIFATALPNDNGAGFPAAATLSTGPTKKSKVVGSKEATDGWADHLGCQHR